MTKDEKAIRKVLATWLSASKAGDTETVLKQMSDDAVFMVPGKEPFGKEAFAAASKGMAGIQIKGTSKIVELKILGDWAWMRCRLRMTITLLNNKKKIVRSGYTLSILQKQSNGHWVIARDANMLTLEADSKPAR